MKYSIYNNDEEKAGCIRRYFCNSLSPEVNAYTLEASLLGYVPDPNSDEAPIPGAPIDPKNPKGIVPYTDESYCRIGRNLARAMWDFYKILGVIPLEGKLIFFVLKNAIISNYKYEDLLYITLLYSNTIN